MNRPTLVALALLVAVIGFATDAAQASRAPTPAERAAIIQGLPKNPSLHQSCVRYVIRISTVDPGYAFVGFGFPSPLPRGCKAFNGTSLMRRGLAGHWREVAEGSEFFCDGSVPERVVRDLFGDCRYGDSDHFYSPSRNIECVVRNNGSLLACTTFNNGRSAYLYRSGRVQVHAAPAATFFHQGSGTVLPYGQYWTCARLDCSTVKPFECESLNSGIKCELLVITGGKGHGFVIARQGVHTF